MTHVGVEAALLRIEEKMKRLYWTRLCAMTIVMLAALAALAACSPGGAAVPPRAQGDNPYAPQTGDAAMMRGELRIDSSSLVVAESVPPKTTLEFDYFQPTPCYQPRVVVSQPDAQGRINVSAYAVAEKDKPCSLMALATPLKASVPLGSFPKGSYSVWLNGIRVGAFDS
jgi:hypothetical protein